MLRVATLREETERAVADLFIANKRNRLNLYNEQIAELKRLKEARAQAYAQDEEVIGGKIGNVAKRKTVTREGKDGTTVIIEVSYDRAIDAELREVSKQAAIEMGQYQEKREITGRDGSPLIPIVEVVIDRSAERDIPEE